MNKPQDEPPPTTLLQTIGSVLASFFGVQSSAKRHRDFTRGRASHFIIVGLIMTVLFVLSLVLLVHLLIGAASH